METLDSVIIANALPSMARSLHIDVVRMNLAITAYLLAAAVTLPVSAWIADRFGARRVFRTAILAFVISSLLCGIAANFEWLIWARLAQGAAGALMVPVGRLVLLRSVPRSELVQAMAWLTIPAVLGPVIGPPLGGFLVTYFSWRLIFLINLPIGLIGLILSSLYIPDIRELDAGALDLKGFVLIALGLAAFNFGLEAFGQGSLDATRIILLLGGSMLCLGVYLGHARRIDRPLLEVRLFRLPTFYRAVVGGLFSRLVLGAGPFMLALLLQNGFAMSAFSAGLLTFAGAIGSLTMKFIAPPVIRRLGFRNLLTLNGALVAATTAACAMFRVTTPHIAIFAVLFVSGFVRSLQYMALNALVYAEVAERQMGQASSLATMAQQMSQSFGVALAATAVRCAMLWRGGMHIEPTDIRPAFVVIAALSLISVWMFASLHADAGAELTGRAS